MQYLPYITSSQHFQVQSLPANVGWAAAQAHAAHRQVACNPGSGSGTRDFRTGISD